MDDDMALGNLSNHQSSRSVGLRLDSPLETCVPFRSGDLGGDSGGQSSPKFLVEGMELLFPHQNS